MARDQMSGVTTTLFFWVPCPEFAFHSLRLFVRLSVQSPCAGWVGVVLGVPLDQVVEHVVLVIGHGRASIAGGSERERKESRMSGKRQGMQIGRRRQKETFFSEANV